MSPWGYVGAGFGLSLVAAFVMALGSAGESTGVAWAVTLFGAVGVGVGAVLTFVGVVAQGVYLGLKEHRLQQLLAESRTEPVDDAQIQ